MANINIKENEIFVNPRVPVGAYFTIQFRLNNRELFESFDGTGCSWIHPVHGKVFGHPTQPSVQIVDSGGNIVKNTTEYTKVDPPSSKMDDGRVCCPIESAGGVGDPLVEFVMRINEPGEYSVVATSDPDNHPSHSVQVGLEVVESDELDEGETGSPERREGGEIDPGNGDSGGGDGGNNRLLQTVIENPVGTGIVVIGGTVALRSVLQGGE